MHYCYYILERQIEEKAMFNIEFYSTADGVSELWNFLNDLLTNKDVRIAQTDLPVHTVA